ncbi:odorant receptor coreceptor [Schistocerca gregaria]|uniref:odorant receptor coreceptor n=1 Tax=Schistocerca gregaria TaxID=7010 RepID=UPI00211E740B|nr:odorant receptor coreceptor [Schistocerca gregaria]
MQKPHGLVADLWPLIRMVQYSGHWMLEYSGGLTALRAIYSSVVSVLVVTQFALMAVNLIQRSGDVNELAANTITVLFFLHPITKFAYFAVRSKAFYRTLATWNQSNNHPLFAESQARFHQLSVVRMRRLVMYVVSVTALSVVSWTSITFMGDSTREVADPDNANETITEEVPRLMISTWYPFDASSGMGYMLAFVYQLYWLTATLMHSNLMDVMFCCWLIYACEQLVHLKEIMKPLMELSATLDTVVPHTSELFRAASTLPTNEPLYGMGPDMSNGVTDGMTIRGIYSSQRDFSGFNRRSAALSTVREADSGGAVTSAGGIGPNGLSKRQEMLVRSAIKYWVERHKHVVRFVGNIGDAYGAALLLHMLTTTVTLTLLAYQATKIDSVDVYAASVLGYLFYTLGQVFLFCVFGNRLIEESSSVMEAAYSCHWYDGSEEAKTFVQIVCQQCQKSLMISGAKFFTVSLDLFASVLGAVVTYFMVLVQLK